MSAEHGYWRIDPHAHAADIEPAGDARECIPPLTKPQHTKLLNDGTINGISLLAHDGLPKHSYKSAIKFFPDTPVLIGNEITAQIPKHLKENPDSKIPRAIHLIGLYEDMPENWRLERVEWERCKLKRLLQVSSLPPIDEAIAQIREQNGIPVLAHPSSRRLALWGSIRPGEIENLHEAGLLDDVALEVNAHWFFRKRNDEVRALADKLQLPIVGGSDAHHPRAIAEYTTQFPKRSGNIFNDLKHGLASRTTEVIDNTR